MFIDDFYYGNIDAQKTKLYKSQKFRKKSFVLSETERKLLENLDRDNLVLFEQYVDAWSYVNSETSKESFKNGFKLGAKCTFDVFDD